MANKLSASKKKSTRPLVSIITPVFNMGTKYLELCIKSVLNQSYSCIEHIFVDGGSTDGTLDILKKHKSKHPTRIRFISEPDKGAGDAWNKGLKLAKGEIFGWLGADDTYQPDAIKMIVGFFRSNPNAYVVFGGCNLIDERGNLIRKYPKKDFNLNEAINTGSSSIPLTSAFFKRNVIDKVGFINTQETGVEFDYWIRVGRVFQIHRINKTLSNFRVHKSCTSASKRAYRMYCREAFIVCRRHGGQIFSPCFGRYLFSLLISPLELIPEPFYSYVSSIGKKFMRQGREKLFFHF